jgi:hypothetical protein
LTWACANPGSRTQATSVADKQYDD